MGLTARERESSAASWYRIKPLLEMISAWQSLTVSPRRLSSSPLTQRFPTGERQQLQHISNYSANMLTLCSSLRVYIPVPRLTTVPRVSDPFLITMVARIFLPRRLCWIRAVSALKRWWLNMAIWSCIVLPDTGNWNIQKLYYYYYYIQNYITHLSL